MRLATTIIALGALVLVTAPAASAADPLPTLVCPPGSQLILNDSATDTWCALGGPDDSPGPAVHPVSASCPAGWTVKQSEERYSCERNDPPPAAIPSAGAPCADLDRRGRVRFDDDGRVVLELRERPRTCTIASSPTNRYPAGTRLRFAEIRWTHWGSWAEGHATQRSGKTSERVTLKLSRPRWCGADRVFSRISVKRGRYTDAFGYNCSIAA
jgi:hypothetical protein